jgi:hypothetical protein
MRASPSSAGGGFVQDALAGFPAWCVAWVAGEGFRDSSHGSLGRRCAEKRGRTSARNGIVPHAAPSAPPRALSPHCRWDDLENNPALQAYTNYALGFAYGSIALVALVRNAGSRAVWWGLLLLRATHVSICACSNRRPGARRCPHLIRPCTLNPYTIPRPHNPRSSWCVYSCACQSTAGPPKRCSTSSTPWSAPCAAPASCSGPRWTRCTRTCCGWCCTTCQVGGGRGGVGRWEERRW